MVLLKLLSIRLRQKVNKFQKFAAMHQPDQWDQWKSIVTDCKKFTDIFRVYQINPYFALYLAEILLCILKQSNNFN